jgi:hypothetical protein
LGSSCEFDPQTECQLCLFPVFLTVFQILLFNFKRFKLNLMTFELLVK